jgi:hypothetical protein
MTDLAALQEAWNVIEQQIAYSISPEKPEPEFEDLCHAQGLLQHHFRSSKPRKPDMDALYSEICNIVKRPDGNIMTPGQAIGAGVGIKFTLEYLNQRGLINGGVKDRITADECWPLDNEKSQEPYTRPRIDWWWLCKKLEHKRRELKKLNEWLAVYKKRDEQTTHTKPEAEPKDVDRETERALSVLVGAASGNLTLTPEAINKHKEAISQHITRPKEPPIEGLAEVRSLIASIAAYGPETSTDAFMNAAYEEMRQSGKKALNILDKAAKRELARGEA